MRLRAAAAALEIATIEDGHRDDVTRVTVYIDLVVNFVIESLYLEWNNRRHEHADQNYSSLGLA